MKVCVHSTCLPVCARAYASTCDVIRACQVVCGTVTIMHHAPSCVGGLADAGNGQQVHHDALAVLGHGDVRPALRPAVRHVLVAYGDGHVVRHLQHAVRLGDVGGLRDDRPGE